MLFLGTSCHERDVDILRVVQTFQGLVPDIAPIKTVVLGKSSIPSSKGSIFVGKYIKKEIQAC